MRKMVMMKDPDGKPRAYGVHKDEGEARKEAYRQLELYRQRKQDVDDWDQANATYTEEVVDCE